MAALLNRTDADWKPCSATRVSDVMDWSIRGVMKHDQQDGQLENRLG